MKYLILILVLLSGCFHEEYVEYRSNPDLALETVDSSRVIISWVERDNAGEYFYSLNRVTLDGAEVEVLPMTRDFYYYAKDLDAGRTWDFVLRVFATYDTSLNRTMFFSIDYDVGVIETEVYLSGYTHSLNAASGTVSSTWGYLGYIRDMLTGEMLEQIDLGYGNDIYDLRFSNDGSAYSLAVDSSVTVFSWPENVALYTVDHSDRIYRAVPSASGDKLLYLDRGNILREYVRSSDRSNTVSMSYPADSAALSEPLDKMEYLENGNLILLQSQDNVLLVDAGSRQVLHALFSGDITVTSLELTDDDAFTVLTHNGFYTVAGPDYELTEDAASVLVDANTLDLTVALSWIAVRKSDDNTLHTYPRNDLSRERRDWFELMNFFHVTAVPGTDLFWMSERMVSTVEFSEGEEWHISSCVSSWVADE